MKINPESDQQFHSQELSPELNSPLQWADNYEVQDGEHAQGFGVSLLPDGRGANYAVHAAGNVDFVDLCIQDPADPSNTKLRWRLNAEENRELGGKIFSGLIPGLKPGDVYCLRAGGEHDPPYLLTDYEIPLLDPHAKQITFHRRDTANTREPFPELPYSVVASSSYDWGNDMPPAVEKKNRVIYETHVRGATMQHPEIPEEQRGTYSGFASDAHIAHLKELGVTTVELLPVHQFVSEEFHTDRGLPNYWGYSTLGFFAPHEAYASTADPVTEFKDMVKKLHEADIEVVLDVVYNHTAEGGAGGPVYSLKGLDNQGMYHMDSHGNYFEKTGCGNMLDASRPAGLRLVMDSLHYWVDEMHVDGFRFDLAPALARDSRHDGRVYDASPFMKAVAADRVLQDKLLISEPWDTEGYAYGGVGMFHRTDPQWQEWNGFYRDGVRDMWGERGMYGVNGMAHLLGGMGMSEGSVNFVTAHDGFTGHDVVSYGRKHNERNLEGGRDGNDNNHSSNFGIEGETDNQWVRDARTRALRNMITTLLLSGGTPMLLGGDEVLRTQRGNNNAYCQDNEISWTNWEYKDEAEQMLKFVSATVAIRQASRVGDPATLSEQPIAEHPLGERPISWLNQWGWHMQPHQWHDGTRVVGMYRSGNGAAQVGKSILAYFNLGYESVDVALPRDMREQGVYGVMLDTATGFADSEANERADDSIRMQPRSMVVLERQSSPLPPRRVIAEG